jgi:hypothetical protein
MGAVALGTFRVAAGMMPFLEILKDRNQTTTGWFPAHRLSEKDREQLPPSGYGQVDVRFRRLSWK